MEELIKEIQAYAQARGIKPATVVNYAAQIGTPVWDRWVSGKSTCSLRTAERIREYMLAHPLPGSDHIAIPAHDKVTNRTMPENGGAA